MTRKETLKRRMNEIYKKIVTSPLPPKTQFKTLGAEANKIVDKNVHFLKNLNEKDFSDIDKVYKKIFKTIAKKELIRKRLYLEK